MPPVDSRSETQYGLERKFLSALIEDVIEARARLLRSPTQTASRDVVRTTFAAIEGLAWQCREHVRSIAASMKELTPLTEMALRERTYTVTEQGDVIEQVRFVTLPAMIRLTAKQAKLVYPQLDVDFGHVGWSRLRSAIVVRHRVTHPKTIADLTVDDNDLETLANGFAWILATAEYIMGSVVSAHRSYNADMRTLLDQLSSGDPDALRAYHQAAEAVDDDN